MFITCKGAVAEQRRRSASEECKDEVVESRDDKQGREKQGKSSKKAPSVDLPASDFVCFSHFFTHNSACSLGAHDAPYAKQDAISGPEVSPAHPYRPVGNSKVAGNLGRIL